MIGEARLRIVPYLDDEAVHRVISEVLESITSRLRDQLLRL